MRNIVSVTVQLVILSCRSADSLRVEGTLLKKYRSSWTQLRPHLMSSVFTASEQCQISKLHARTDSTIACENMTESKRDQLLRDNRCFVSGMTPPCSGSGNVEQQTLRWDGAQRGPNSKPSTFLDVLQRLSSGTNTILLLGDSTMGGVFQESMCSLVRHLPEHLLDNLTRYEGATGSSTEVNQIGAAGGQQRVRDKVSGKQVTIFWAT